jgi:hypothetical protein
MNGCVHEVSAFAFISISYVLRSKASKYVFSFSRTLISWEVEKHPFFWFEISISYSLIINILVSLILELWSLIFRLIYPQKLKWNYPFLVIGIICGVDWKTQCLMCIVGELIKLRDKIAIYMTSSPRSSFSIKKRCHHQVLISRGSHIFLAHKNCQMLRL